MIEDVRWVLMIVPANFQVLGTSNKEDRGGDQMPPPPGLIMLYQIPGLNRVNFSEWFSLSILVS